MLEFPPELFERSAALMAARAAFPEAPEPWLDLTTAISPWAYPHAAPGPSVWQSLPDATSIGRLVDAARASYRAPKAAKIVPVPGVDAALGILPWLFRSSRDVAVLGPGDGRHAKAWEAAGHSVSWVRGVDETRRAAIIVAMNPSDPDGRVLAPGELAAAAKEADKRDGIFLLDETFADENPGLSILPLASRLDRTVVLRSLPEFYGMPGMRLGFAITSHPIADRLASALGPWSTCPAAVAFGEAALKDETWASAQRRKLAEAATALESLLTGAGFRIEGGTSLFRLAGHPESYGMFERLAKRGILALPFKERAALRFGLPGDERALNRLREALSL